MYEKKIFSNKKRFERIFNGNINSNIISIIWFSIISIKMNNYIGPSLIDLDIMGKQKIIFSSLDGSQYYNYLENRSNVEFVTINNLTQINDRTIATEDFMEKVYQISKDTENSENHEVDMDAEDYIGYYSSILMFSDENSRYEFMMALTVINIIFIHFN